MYIYISINRTHKPRPADNPGKTNMAISKYKFKADDGGAKAAGFGRSGDCVARALAIAEGISYRKALEHVANSIDDCYSSRKQSGRHGVPGHITTRVFQSMGYTYIETPGKKFRPGQGMPRGRVIARVRGHVAAVINGTIRDTWDSQKKGRVQLRGYFIKLS